MSWTTSWTHSDSDFSGNPALHSDSKSPFATARSLLALTNLNIKYVICLWQYMIAYGKGLKLSYQDTFKNTCLATTYLETHICFFFYYYVRRQGDRAKFENIPVQGGTREILALSLPHKHGKVCDRVMPTCEHIVGQCSVQATQTV